MPRTPKVRETPEPRIKVRVSPPPKRLWANTPGAKASTSSRLATAPSRNAAASISVVPPGTRVRSSRASSIERVVKPVGRVSSTVISGSTIAWTAEAKFPCANATQAVTASIALTAYRQVWRIAKVGLILQGLHGLQGAHYGGDGRRAGYDKLS